MSNQPIVTLTLNPAMDLTIQLAECQLGAVNLAEEGHLFPAGKGVNVAMVLRDFGKRVSVTGILGEDNRGPFDLLFKRYEFENHFLYLPGETRVNVKISESGQRITDINLPGLQLPSTVIAELESQLKRLTAQSKLFVLSGSVPGDLNPNVYAQIVALLKQKDCDVIVDTSGKALKTVVEAAPDIIKPNVAELEQWAGCSLPGREEQEEVVKQLLAKDIKHVVLSDGSKGVRWYSHNEAFEALPPKVQVLSTVGAGDSMVAGIAYGIANGRPIPEILSEATAIAAMAVTQVRVGITSTQVLNELKQQVTVKPLPFSL